MTEKDIAIYIFIAFIFAFGFIAGFFYGKMKLLEDQQKEFESLLTASLPSFPDRIELPSSRSNKRGNLRWVAAEVKEWALLHRRKKKA